MSKTKKPAETPPPELSDLKPGFFSTVRSGDVQRLPDSNLAKVADTKEIAVARIAYEAQRQLRLALAETPTPVAFDHLDAAEHQKFVDGARMFLLRPHLAADEMHRSWAIAKLAEGWKYGPTKDEEAKTHPRLIPFESLPTQDQMKDKFFRDVIVALCSGSHAFYA